MRAQAVSIILRHMTDLTAKYAVVSVQGHWLRVNALDDEDQEEDWSSTPIGTFFCVFIAILFFSRQPYACSSN
jgi:hypothetical protein